MFSYGITNIGDYAFVQNALPSVSLPGSLMSIGDQAFYDNGSLTNVTMGAGVASITAGAFQECFKLTNVFIQGNAPAVVGLTGDGPVFLDTSTTVYYLPGTTGWSNTYG
jgi:BspA type Leucine rich repeat region (6 copies)